MDEREDITELLLATDTRGPEAMDELFASVYPRLRELAHARRDQWQGNHTLSATALVHEAYLKVAGGGGTRFKSRGHFFASAAKAMRQILINYAEGQRAAKRGGGERAVTLDEGHAVDAEPTLELLALDEALTRLGRMSERQARVVECFFFAGLGVEETAEALEISPATVKRDWSTARAWLHRELQSGGESAASGSA